MKLGVIAALRTELNPTLKAFPNPGPFTFVAGGIGVEKAAAASLDLLKQGKPDALLSVGFCGALTDDLEVGDLLLGGTTRYQADAELLEQARAAWPKAHRGLVATVTRVINDSKEKLEIARKTGARAVEMEADAVGRAAKDAGIGFLCVKVVIDTPKEPLASTYAGCWTILRDILLRPGTVGQMIYDSKRVKVAAERLRDFFIALELVTRTP